MITKAEIFVSKKDDTYNVKVTGRATFAVGPVPVVVPVSAVGPVLVLDAARGAAMGRCIRKRPANDSRTARNRLGPMPGTRAKRPLLAAAASSP